MELVAQQNVDSFYNHLVFTELLVISLVITKLVLKKKLAWEIVSKELNSHNQAI